MHLAGRSVGAMSILVDLDRLADTLEEYGAGYLVTVSPDGRAKVVTVDAAYDAGTLRLPPSRGSAANLAANDAATLAFPPPAPRGYTLLVDGTAAVDAEGIIFSPVAAVLHRPADHADGPPPPDGCGNDCRPV